MEQGVPRAGLLVLCVLLALAYVQSAPVDTVDQPAQIAEDVKDVDDSAAASEDAQDVGKHHPHHPDHHDGHDDDDHHHGHDDHDHHHGHDDHDHHHDDDDHQHPPANVCANARADRWHLPCPWDSHKFFKCDLNTGKGTLLTCPSGLVFNPAIQVCAYA